MYYVIRCGVHFCARNAMVGSLPRQSGKSRESRIETSCLAPAHCEDRTRFFDVARTSQLHLRASLRHPASPTAAIATRTLAVAHGEDVNQPNQLLLLHNFFAVAHISADSAILTTLATCPPSSLTTQPTHTSTSTGAEPSPHLSPWRRWPSTSWSPFRGARLGSCYQSRPSTR